MERDMTKGSVAGELIRFAVPVVLGLLLQKFYNMVDTAIVGHILGSVALGAVGLTGSLDFLVIGFCNGLCAGMVLPVARSFGAADLPRMRRYIANCIWIGIAVSLLLVAGVVPQTRRILTLMHTQPEQFEGAYRYIVIIFCGIPATMLYNLTAGVLRSLGDSRTPLLFLLLSSLANVGLDFLCIGPLGLDTAGAAIATVASSLIAGLCCLVFLKRRFTILRMERDELRFRPRLSWDLLVSGVPMGLQFSITAIGSVILQSAVNGLGAVYVSAQSAAHKFNSLNTALYDGIGNASASFIGQNLGARRYDRIKKGTLTCLVLSLGVWVFFTGLILLLRERAALIFVEPEELETIGQLVFVNCLCYIGCGPLLAGPGILRPGIQGMGYSNFAMLSGVMELIGRTLIGLWLIPRFGYMAACFASPLAWLLADCFLIPGYRFIYRRISRRKAPAA